LRLKEGHRIALNYDHISALQKDDKTDNEVKEIKARAVKTYVDAGYSKEEALKLVEEIAVPPVRAVI
jgi:DNA-binding transcriptional regulator YhcF (GntR family)